MSCPYGLRPSSLSVAIITGNEERHIGDALASIAGLASQVVVVLDSRTHDRTAAICRDYGATVHVEAWRGYPAQRNRALDLCEGDWVLFLDADERVTDELRDEIRAVLAQDNESPDTRAQTRELRHESPDTRAQTQTCHSLSPVSSLQSPVSSLQSPVSYVGYWIPRYNRFFGRTVRGGGWYPDHQLRLVRRGRARYDETRLVHELVQLDGPAGYLSGHILHLNIERLDELWRKQTSYALYEAQMLYLAGRRAQWRNFVGAPLREFRRRYLTLGGYRDGALGLLLCGTLAYFEWVKYIHLKGLELAR